MPSASHSKPPSHTHNNQPINKRTKMATAIAGLRPRQPNDGLSRSTRHGAEHVDALDEGEWATGAHAESDCARVCIVF